MSHPPRNEPHVPLSWSTGLPYLASQWVRDGHPLGAASALLRAGFEFRRGRSVPSSPRRIGIQHTLLTCTSRIGTSRHSLSPSPRASRSRPRCILMRHGPLCRTDLSSRLAGCSASYVGCRPHNLPALKGGDSGGTTVAASRVVRPWEGPSSGLATAYPARPCPGVQPDYALTLPGGERDGDTCGFHTSDPNTTVLEVVGRCSHVLPSYPDDAIHFTSSTIADQRIQLSKREHALAKNLPDGNAVNLRPERRRFTAHPDKLCGTVVKRSRKLLFRHVRRNNP